VTDRSAAFFVFSTIAETARTHSRSKEIFEEELNLEAQPIFPQIKSLSY
jgi:hypothetical protein